MTTTSVTPCACPRYSSVAPAGACVLEHDRWSTHRPREPGQQNTYSRHSTPAYRMARALARARAEQNRTSQKTGAFLSFRVPAVEKGGRKAKIGGPPKAPAVNGSLGCSMPIRKTPTPPQNSPHPPRPGDPGPSCAASFLRSPSAAPVPPAAPVHPHGPGPTPPPPSVTVR